MPAILSQDEATTSSSLSSRPVVIKSGVWGCACAVSPIPRSQCGHEGKKRLHSTPYFACNCQQYDFFKESVRTQSGSKRVATQFSSPQGPAAPAMERPSCILGAWGLPGRTGSAHGSCRGLLLTHHARHQQGTPTEVLYIICMPAATSFPRFMTWVGTVASVTAQGLQMEPPQHLPRITRFRSVGWQ